MGPPCHYTWAPDLAVFSWDFSVPSYLGASYEYSFLLPFPCLSSPHCWPDNTAALLHGSWSCLVYRSLLRIPPKQSGPDISLHAIDRAAILEHVLHCNFCFPTPTSGDIVNFFLSQCVHPLTRFQEAIHRTLYYPPSSFPFVLSLTFWATWYVSGFSPHILSIK